MTNFAKLQMISLVVLKKINSLKYMNTGQGNNMAIYLYVLNCLRLIGSLLVKAIKFNS